MQRRRADIQVTDIQPQYAENSPRRQIKATPKSATDTRYRTILPKSCDDPYYSGKKQAVREGREYGLTERHSWLGSKM